MHVRYSPLIVATKADAGDMRESPTAALKSRASNLFWLRAILRSTFSSCLMASDRFCLQQQEAVVRAICKKLSASLGMCCKDYEGRSLSEIVKNKEVVSAAASCSSETGRHHLANRAGLHCQDHK